MTTLPTGVPGLDVVLGGGLEPGGVMIVAGAPGTGKTILAQQMCFAAAAAGRRALYYTTLSEPHDKMVRHLEGFEFFTPDLLGRIVEYLHVGDLLREDASGHLEVFVSEVARKAMEDRPALVVIDSAKALRDFSDERDLRSVMYDLTSRLSHAGAGLVLVGEYTPEDVEVAVEFALADGIIQLYYEPREPIDRRWLRVVKMRGREHLVGKHTIRIARAGIEVFPRIETLDPGMPAVVTGRISSGIPGLDQLMGGGIGSGEATVVLGPSGVGKTILALGFVTEGIARGDGCLYVTFQDTAEQLIKMAATFGWDLAPARSDGRLILHHVPIGELDLDILAMAIATALADGTINRVVIDSLAEMVVAARESERFPAYARSLIGIIRAAGAALVVTSETNMFGPSSEPVGGITFLFHNVIMLRYIEMGARTGRVASVVKMRNSGHDNGVHQVAINDDGLRIGDRALKNISGSLGWSALRAPDTARAVDGDAEFGRSWFSRVWPGSRR